MNWMFFTCAMLQVYLIVYKESWDEYKVGFEDLIFCQNAEIHA